MDFSNSQVKYSGFSLTKNKIFYSNCERRHNVLLSFLATATFFGAKLKSFIFFTLYNLTGLLESDNPFFFVNINAVSGNKRSPTAINMHVKRG